MRKSENRSQKEIILIQYPILKKFSAKPFTMPNIMQSDKNLIQSANPGSIKQKIRITSVYRDSFLKNKIVIKNPDKISPRLLNFIIRVYN